MKIYATALIVATGIVATSAFLLTSDRSVSTDATASPTATQGMVAVLDSETGELRAPTSAEAQKYAGTSRKPVAEAVVERRADGSESMQLDDSYTIYSVVTRGEDGQWDKTCTADHDHALDRMKAADARAVK